MFSEELKAALVEQLGDQIGQYRFSNGSVTPSIRVDDGSDPYPEEPTVTGLELVIAPQIEVAVAPMMGGWKETYTTLIVLKQWDIEQTTNQARTAVLYAINQFSELSIGPMRRVIRSTKLDNIETLTFSVTQQLWIEDEQDLD